MIRNSHARIAGWNVGRDGELYAVDHYSGLIKTLVRAADDPPRNFPEWITETGCMDPDDPTLPGTALIPFEINAPFWSDGAEKRRWLAMPDDGQIELLEDLDFDLPVGSVLVKDFRDGGELVETRLLMRHDDGNWSGTAYAWLPDHSDAYRVDWDMDYELAAGGTREVPGPAQCVACHTTIQAGSLGPELGQLNRTLVYDNGRAANQIDTWAHLGFFAEDLGEPSDLFVMPDPLDDVSFTLEERAQSYLHTNCSQCHVLDGQGVSDMELDYFADISTYCGTVPFITDMGVPGAFQLKPGEPEASLIWMRIDDVHGGYRMPPVGTYERDDVGAQLIYDYIASLTACR